MFRAPRLLGKLDAMSGISYIFAVVATAGCLALLLVVVRNRRRGGGERAAAECAPTER